MKKITKSVILLAGLGSVSIFAGSENYLGNVYYGDLTGDNLVPTATEGRNNTMMGYAAGEHTSSGMSSVYIGVGAGNKNSDGDLNVYLGGGAGAHTEHGDKNVFLGARTGVSAEIGNSILIGYEAGSSAARDNILMVENSDTNASLIYGEFDKDMIRINGTLEVNSTKIDISDAQDGSKWGYPALSLQASDIPITDMNWLLALVSEGDTDEDRALAFVNHAGVDDTVPFAILNNAQDELLTLQEKRVIVNGTLENNDIITSSWTGDSNAYLHQGLVLTSNNTNAAAHSEVGFTLLNSRDNLRWDFRLNDNGDSFSATKRDSGVNEFNVYNQAGGQNGIIIKAGNTVIFKNNSLVNNAGTPLATLIEEQGILLAETQTALKAKDTEIIALKDEQTKMKEELIKSNMKIAQLETMKQKVAMLESLLTNLALNTNNIKKEKVSLNK